MHLHKQKKVVGKGLQTHLVPEEKEAREVNEKARRWSDFCRGPDLPQAQR